MAKVTIANLNTLLNGVVTSNIAVQTAQTAVTNATVQADKAATSAQAAALSKSQIDQQAAVISGLADDINADVLAATVIKDAILALEEAIRLDADQVTLDRAAVATMLGEVLTAKSGVDVKAGLIEELVEDFHTKYLGALLVAPTVSWGGMELATGMIYYDIAKNSLMIYINANTWVPIIGAINALIATNNLSDIPDKEVARTNLGVLSAAETEANIQADIVAIKGKPLGLAELDAAGLVPASQLPSYVDDVIEVATYADLPAIGEKGKIYIVVADETSDGNTNSYRWADTVYARVSNTLTAADVKSLYESNLDTNAFTDAEKLSVGVSTTLNTTATTLPTAINEIHGEVDAHLLDTSVHGVTAVVGTVETQALTNKTMDDISNWIGANHIHYNIKALENLPAGAVVMGMGYNSGEDVFEVSKWTVASGKPALGMNHHTLLTGEIGFIAQSGQIKDIDTSLLTVGTVYYPADGGLLTATKPTTGSYQAAVYVLRSHSSQGAVTVNFAAPISIASTTQAGYVQLNNTLTSTSTTEALTSAQGKVLKDILVTSNIERADKYLAAQNIANMVYTGDDLTKIQYNTATDVDYEVLTYGVDGLSNIAHYVGGALAGNTVLTYAAGDLVSAVYTGV